MENKQDSIIGTDKLIFLIDTDYSLAIGDITDKKGYQKVKLDIHKLSSAIEMLKFNPQSDDYIYLFVKDDFPIQIGYEENLGIIIAPVEDKK